VAERMTHLGDRIDEPRSLARSATGGR
jgi:hypothetical protein